MVLDSSNDLSLEDNKIFSSVQTFIAESKRFEKKSKLCNKNIWEGDLMNLALCQVVGKINIFKYLR